MNGESPLVDTSVPIDYFTGVRCRETALLEDLRNTGLLRPLLLLSCRRFLRGLIDDTVCSR
jgi:hypothetical protein